MKLRLLFLITLPVTLPLLACRTTRPELPVAPPSSAPVSAPAAPAPAAADPEPPSGGVDLSILDRSVSPCDDFYQFACGTWIKNAQIPADKPMWSRGFLSIAERNEKLLKDILEAAAAGRRDPQDPYADKVGDYYAACMDEAAIEASAPAELAEVLRRIDAVKDPAGLAEMVGKMHAGGAAPLFDFGSQQDFKDATLVIAGFSQGGLGLPDRDFYFRSDPKSKKILTNYQGHVARMLKLAGLSVPDRRAAKVVAFEKKLAQSHFTNVQMRDPKRIYNRVELAGLEKLAPRFPWRGFLAAVGRADITAITISTPDNFQSIGRLATQTPIDDLRSYLKWQLIHAQAGALSRAFVDESFAFDSENITGQKQLAVRWKRCATATDRALGQALGAAYVRRHFPGAAKARTSAMVGEVEQVFGKALDQLAWMDADTRQHAREKLGKIFNKVGYPDVWRNYDRLTVTRGSYLTNRMAAAAFETARDLAKIGKPVDRSEWQMSPPTVNAYYDPQLNEMVFPAGILQPPFFNLAAAAPVNYGAMGMVVGHELTHGFDDEGRQFDAEGNLKDWWAPAVGKEFEARARCLVKQYAGYVAVDDVKLNGELTLGENIADLGGLKTAYAAYRASLAGKPEPPPADGFTVDQQFFLGHAQAWCSKISDAFARTLAQTDPHAPAKQRVNGPLSNLPPFAAAFSCKEGSAMVKPPADRCTIW
jgi:endothelin-converting enzyme/putative endopeptidase